MNRFFSCVAVILMLIGPATASEGDSDAKDKNNNQGNNHICNGADGKDGQAGEDGGDCGSQTDDD